MILDDGMRRITFGRPAGLSSVSLSVEVLLSSIPPPVTVTVKRDGVAKRKTHQSSPDFFHTNLPQDTERELGGERTDDVE